MPQAAKDLLALKQSYWYNFSSFLTVSLWNSFGFGALWKYKYPPKISSAPSPDKTIFIPMDFITLAIRYIGVEALTVVTSYVSKWKITSLIASKPSWIVKVTSWWIDPMWSATSLAACKSGEPTRPTAKECSCGYHAAFLSSDSTLFLEYFFANAEVIEESNPPDKRTP